MKQALTGSQRPPANQRFDVLDGFENLYAEVLNKLRRELCTFETLRRSLGHEFHGPVMLRKQLQECA